MKTLWFSNTPGLSSDYLNQNSFLRTGSWMYRINEEMASIVELHIVFPGKVKRNFKYKDTYFYEFPLIKWNFLKKLINKIWLVKYDIKYIKKELEKIIRKIKPDIIHIFGTELPWCIIQESVSVPVIISIQGNLNVYYEFYFSGITEWDILKYAGWKTKKRIYLNNLFMKKRLFIEKKILKTVKYIIGRTDWDRRITRILAPESQYFYNEETLRNKFYKNEWKIQNITKGQLKIFTISRENTYKGLETIIQSSNLLDDLNIDFQWFIGGILNNSWITKILKKKMGRISSHLVFLGIISEDEIIKKMQESHIYILPSHIENSPLTLSEAMVMGIPVISTFAGGTSSRLENGKDGLVIQSGDAYSLTGAILETIDNYEKAIEMGRNARKRALERHNPKKIVNELLSIYKNVIENEN